MVFRVERHAVIALASTDGIAPDDLIGRRIDHGEDVLVLQIHVDLPRHGIVLRHAGLALEVQRLDDGVGAHVNNRFRLAAFVRDVQLVERRRVRAPVRLGLCG